MHERLEKIKAHVKDHKTTYIACGVTAVATGVTVYVAMRHKIASVDSSVGVYQGVAVNSPVTVNNTTIVELVRRGHPGYKIQNVTTGETFASIKRAADMCGVARTTLQRHLNGELPDAGGYVFTNLGEM